MLGQDLYDQRSLQQLTQSDMATAMGVSLRSYCRYEASTVTLPLKVELMAKAVMARAVSIQPKRDGRTVKVIDYLARDGKPMFVYQGGVEVGHLAHEVVRKGGDTAQRYRAKTLEEALAHPTMTGRRIARSEERDDSIHIWLG
jgi:hypothetical protein